MALDIQERSQADRLRAFELFLSASSTGKPMSHRQIAAELGVSSMTIGRWAKVDNWDIKLNKVLAQTANTVETTSQAVKRRVRVGFLDGLDALQSIISDKNANAKDRIAAANAMASIALKVEALTSGAFGKEKVAERLTFNDDLPGEPNGHRDESAAEIREASENVEIATDLAGGFTGGRGLLSVGDGQVSVRGDKTVDDGQGRSGTGGNLDGGEESFELLSKEA